MQSIKTLGAVAVAALLVLAIAGASSAAADTFCEENVGAKNECPAGKRLAAGDLILGKTNVAARTVLLWNNGGKNEPYITCDAKFLLKVGANQGASTGRLGIFESLEFTECEGKCFFGLGHSAPLLFKAVALEGHIFIYQDPETGLRFGFEFFGCSIEFDTCLYQSTGEVFTMSVESDFANVPSVLMEKSDPPEPATPCLKQITWDAQFLMTLDKEGKAGAPVYLAAKP